MKIGVIGCGKIFHAYAEGAEKYSSLTITRVADLDLDRAAATAQKYAIPNHGSVDELLADPEIELVVNLTVPTVHADIDRHVLAAGKHVYSEKPLALTTAEAKPLLKLAAAKGLRLGCAPDTFLGASQQRARQLIDDGAIGQPLSATAFMQNRGHENWHPNPAFYYQNGGGPLFDMGPYYITALVNMLGPIKRVSGMSKRAAEQRIIGSEPLRGRLVDVEVDTHVSALLEFHSGAIATLITSFDVWAHNLPSIQVHGTAGSLNVPDPNSFSGALTLASPTESTVVNAEINFGTYGHTSWQLQNHVHVDGCRGAGVCDMAAAIGTGRPHRASGELAFHVLEVMEAILSSSDKNQFVEILSAPERPDAVAPQLVHTFI